jgi:phosphoglycolate phosphatase/pyrophosphatase PpaX
MYKAILFDFDGTLANTLPICLEAFRRTVLAHGGTNLENREIRSTFGPSEEGVMKVLVPNEPQESLVTYHRHYEELHSLLQAPFEGLAELLGEFRRLGTKLAVVTGKGAQSLEISLRCVGLDGFFDALEAGCERGPCKPEGIERILKSWDIVPSDALYVGDSVHDVRSARQVGMPIAAVSWADPESHSVLAAANPDFIFATVDEFRGWVLSEIAIR